MAEQTPQAGTHKGPLAGLTGQERAKRADEAMQQGAAESARQAVDDYKVALMEENAAEGPLRTTLAEHLDDFTRDELVQLAKENELRGYSKLKKAELIGLIVESTSGADEAFGIVSQMADAEFDTLREVMAQPGCMLEMSAQDVRAAKHRSPCEPWLYLYATGEDTWTFVIPEELRAALAQLDWDAVNEERALIAGARRVAQALCDQCGIVRIEDAAAQFQAWYGQVWEEWVFENIVVQSALSGTAEFGVWLDGDDIYLVHYELDERQLSPDDEDGQRDLEGFKKFLVKKHEANAMPQLDDSLRAHDYIDWVLSLPSAQALISFFDNHVPDDEPDDLFYADGMVEDIAVLNGNLVNFEQTVSDLDERDLCLTAQERDEMLPLVRALLEDLPYWESNGWSNNQLRAAQGAAPVFFDEKGGEMKVGRNDPCPCGSGLKYKKCCGR